jgi:hypothetical protein
MTFLRRKRKDNNDLTHSEPASNAHNVNTRSRSPKTTLKQDKFVEGFIRHGNASRAAREAGYSPRSAAVIASRNLQRPDIQEQIKSRIEAAKLDTDEIIGTLIGHMRADIGNLLGDDGSLDLVRAIENGSTHLIKKLVIRTRRIAGATGATGGSPTVKEGVAPDPDSNLITSDTTSDNYPTEETTYEIVIHDSQAAAWRLARILHLEVKNRPPEARRPTDDELAHRMADLLERARANGRRESAKQRPPTQTMESHSEDVRRSSLERQTPPACPVASSRWPLQKNQSDHEMPPACPVEFSRLPLEKSNHEHQMQTASPAARGAASSSLPLQKSRAVPEMPRELVQEQANPFQAHLRISNAGEPPQARNGLWNRLFGSAEMLTFINPIRTR